MAHPYFGAFDAANPMILGHRGAAGTAPENTLLSFARCLALGAHAIESDVQITADGVPVLLHDADLTRTAGIDVAAAALPLGELQQLDASHHFTIDDRGLTQPPKDDAFRGRGLQVPTVEAAFREFPDARFNLEIKTSQHDAVAKVVALVGAFERADRTLLTAGDDGIMKQLREQIEIQRLEVATSASVADVVALIQSAVEVVAPPGGIQALQIPTRFGGNDLVTPELVAHAHRHDVRIHVWTINEPHEAERLLELGVDGLVSDFPERIARVVAERAVRA